MQTWLIDGDGVHESPDMDEVSKRFDGGEDFWLDIEAPSDAEIDDLGRRFRLHELVIEDSKQFHQRPRFEPYGEYMFIVVFATLDAGTRLREVHVYFGEHFLVTVRRMTCAPVDLVRDTPAVRGDIGRGVPFVLYRILDAIIDTYMPCLEAIEDELDDIEDEIFDHPRPAQLEALAELRRRIGRFRRATLPARDVLATGLAVTQTELPRMGREAERYLRDLYDHLVHVAEYLDGVRDYAVTAMDVYLNVLNNRQNDVMKQLTIVSTIFLPLTFITGFFGMNFGWMVDGINGPAMFFVFGIGTCVLSVIILLTVMRRRQFF